MALRKGIKNAQKHGLYSQRISYAESEMIAALPVGEVDAEIAYQRALISRLAEVIENNGLKYGSKKALTSDTRATVKLLNETMRGLLAYIRRHSSQADNALEYQHELEAGKHLARIKRNVFRYLDPNRRKNPGTRLEP